MDGFLFMQILKYRYIEEEGGEDSMLSTQQLMRRLTSLDVMCLEQPLSWMAMLPNLMFILPLSQSMNNIYNGQETLTFNVHTRCTQNVENTDFETWFILVYMVYIQEAA